MSQAAVAYSCMKNICSLNDPYMPCLDLFTDHLRWSPRPWFPMTMLYVGYTLQLCIIPFTKKWCIYLLSKASSFCLETDFVPSDANVDWPGSKPTSWSFISRSFSSATCLINACTWSSGVDRVVAAPSDSSTVWIGDMHQINRRMIKD